MYWSYPGKTRGQATAIMFVALNDAGARARDHSRRHHKTPQKCWGWQDRVGAVEPGKFADLIAITGNHWLTFLSWSTFGS